MGMPGHQEIELALMKLYEETGKESYKELAKYFIDVRGCGNRNYFLEEMKQKDVKRIFPELNDYLSGIFTVSPSGAQTAHGGRTCSAGSLYVCGNGRYCSGI